MRSPISARRLDLETAALRVFSNAEGAYGANVGMLIDSGAWSDEDQIPQTYARRKCFAYGRNGDAAAQPQLLQSVMEKVDFVYQNSTASNSASPALIIISTASAGWAARSRGLVRGGRRHLHQRSNSRRGKSTLAVRTGLPGNPHPGPQTVGSVLITNYQGKYLNGPNDVWIAPNGAMFITTRSTSALGGITRRWR